MNSIQETWGLDDLLDDDHQDFEPLLEDLHTGSSVFLPTSTEHPFPEEKTIELRAPSEWPAQLPMALALGVETREAILDRFGISPERFEMLLPLPAFRRAIAEAQRDLTEQGHTFKLKCRGIAEDFLDSLYLELHNSSVGLSTKVDIFKYLTKMGGLEPVAAQVSTAPVNAVQININL